MSLTVGSMQRELRGSGSAVAALCAQATGEFKQNSIRISALSVAAPGAGRQARELQHPS